MFSLAVFFSLVFLSFVLCTYVITKSVGWLCQKTWKLDPPVCLIETWCPSLLNRNLISLVHKVYYEMPLESLAYLSALNIICLIITPTNEIKRDVYWSQQTDSWSVGEMLCLKLLPVFKSFKWNLLHTIPMTCRCAWHNFC